MRIFVRRINIPTYEYTCDNCSHSFEEFRFFSEPEPEKCPMCKAKEPDFRQVYSGGQTLIMAGEIKTVGQQAEANAKRVGKEKLKEMEKQDKMIRKGFTGKLPEGAKLMDIPDDPKPEPLLDLKKIKDINKYIKTGEKN